MAESFEELKAEFVDLVRRMHRAGWETRSHHEGVTVAEERALHAIAKIGEQGDVPRPGCVASRMRATPSAVSQTFKSLEEKQLIRRSRACGDFRAVTLELTETGEKVARDVERARDEGLRAAMEHVGSDDFAAFMHTFAKLVDFFEQREGSEKGEKGGRPCA